MLEEDNILKEKIEELEGFISQFLSVTKHQHHSIGDNYTLDVLKNAIDISSIGQIRGFLAMAKQDQFIKAIPYIRLQLDNAYKFISAMIVENSGDFFLHILSNKPLIQYKEKRGVGLNDLYLVSLLEKYYPNALIFHKEVTNFLKIYAVHPESTIINNEKIKKSSKKNNKNNIEINEEFKIKITHAMLEASKIVVLSLKQWELKKHSFLKTEKKKYIFS